MEGHDELVEEAYRVSEQVADYQEALNVYIKFVPSLAKECRCVFVKNQSIYYTFGLNGNSEPYTQ